VLDLWRLAVSEVTNLEKVIKILQEKKDTVCHTCNSQQVTIMIQKLIVSKNVHCLQAREEALKAEASKVREKHLEEQLAAAQGASKKLEKEKDRLQRALDVLQVQIKEMSAQADEGQSKVSDALALVDSACQNRDYTVVALSKSQGKLLRFKYSEKS